MADSWKKIYLGNIGGGGGTWGSITGTLSNQTDLQTALNSKLSKGSETIFCIDNGDFATLQAAIDAAPVYPAQAAIVVGAKSGGWGDIVIPANKNLSIMGLSAPRSDIVCKIGSINFSPTTGSNPVANNVHFSNLFIAPSSGSSCLIFDGTVPARIRFDGCYFQASDTTSVVITNSSATLSSAYFFDCYFDSASASITHITNSCRFVDLERCSFNSGNKAVSTTAGTFQMGTCSVQVNSAAETITISNSGTSLLAGNTLIQNGTTNGSGVNIASSGAVYIDNNNVYNIATGTGYVITGVAGSINLYGSVVTSNSAVTPANVKFKNTVTRYPYTLTLTSSP
jgi:hypothetical protein